MRDPYDVFERDVDQTLFERSEEENKFLEEVLDNDIDALEDILDDYDETNDQDEVRQEYEDEQAFLAELSKPIKL
jgi:hypothetical protein